MAIRLILADEQPVYLLGLQALLAGDQDFQMLACCQDGIQTLEAIRAQPPDILVADLHLPKLSTLELLSEVRAADNQLRVVILTARLDEDDLLALIRLGVRGVLLKSMPPELFIRCLHKVHEGGEWLEKRSASLALEKLLRRETAQQQLRVQLTARERQLAALAARGLTNREIAEQLSIGEGTVKGHLHKIYDKLRVKNRVALSNLAREQGWL